MSGIFITTELEGALAKRIHAYQMRFDPKMGRYLPPHITLIGSSGSGPAPPDTPVDLMKEKILPIAKATPPITLQFGRPERFVQREIVSLRLDPHGPLRKLHEDLKTCGLPFLPSRYPFTPHCTINLYPTLTAANLKAMLMLREEEPFTVHTICVYLTKEPQPPTLLFRAKLEGGA